MTQHLSRRQALRLGAWALMGAALSWPAAVRAQQAQAVAVMTPDAAFAAAQAGRIVLIDIRTPAEWQQTGLAEGAIGLDMTRDDFVAGLVALRQANPETPLALICRTGNRSGHVARALAERGFPGLVDVSEGMAGGRNGAGWLKRGLPTYPGTADEVQRRTRMRLGRD